MCRGRYLAGANPCSLCKAAQDGVRIAVLLLPIPLPSQAQKHPTLKCPPAICAPPVPPKTHPYSPSAVPGSVGTDASLFWHNLLPSRHKPMAHLQHFRAVRGPALVQHQVWIRLPTCHL